MKIWARRGREVGKRGGAGTGALSGSIDTEYLLRYGLEPPFNPSVLHLGKIKILEPLRMGDLLLCAGVWGEWNFSPPSQE